MYRTDFVEENIHTFCVQICFFVNRTVYEEMWRNIAEIGKTQKKIWRMRIACWKLKLHTHSKYVIIMAFFKE